ncbi:helix-turn-helix domain-containing protein [Streptomyces sp. NBC_00885]|uniref:helix-turn-helix domain-containing protein n=1 Tax=Streptomyces sp. NBC_00885 TaxID=2975857 RepID=UPI003863B29E
MATPRERGLGVRKTAERLERVPSTISRELRCNSLPTTMDNRSHPSAGKGDTRVTCNVRLWRTPHSWQYRRTAPPGAIAPTIQAADSDEQGCQKLAKAWLTVSGVRGA